MIPVLRSSHYQMNFTMGCFYVKTRTGFITRVYIKGFFFLHVTSNVAHMTPFGDENYECATCFSIPGERFHTKTSGRTAFATAE